MFRHNGLDFPCLPAPAIPRPGQGSSAAQTTPGKAGAAQRANRTPAVELRLDPALTADRPAPFDELHHAVDLVVMPPLGEGENLTPDRLEPLRSA